MIIVAILNAGRNSFSFFLLLIVCMGYGVVKPSLGKMMWYVRALALTHFVFGVIYAVASLTITPDNAGPLVLLVILPLAATLTAFYVWTLNSLNYTMKDLLERKQSIKAGMYRRLWYCILGSIVVIFGFFFLNSFTFAGRSNPDFVPKHWKTRWFILDGWLNIVYLVDISYVAYLWRPTANNRRFAMSDEVRLHSPFCNLRTALTSYRLHKTMTDLRSLLSEVLWMKKMLNHQTPSMPKAMVTYHRCPQSQSTRIIQRDSLWTARRSSRWARITISGRKMNRQSIRRSGQD